jgi:hypothetical protein
MAAPYTSQSISGYNTNPPPDDGSAVSTNRQTWAGVKTKLADPVKTHAAAIDSQTLAAFGKIIGGAGVGSTGVDYTVQSTDQGKLVRATASAITITTPDAATVTAPFVFAFVNNSSGTVTLDGNGSQTIDGAANLTIPAGGGCICFTDGTNWFTNGVQGTLVGKQLMYADIINGTLAESNSSNAVTYSLKTLAGNDPSSADPVLVCFRNSTAGNGNYVYRVVTAALSLTISAGSTLGTSNATACRVWIVLFDDAGTVRMGAINCLSGANIYPLGRHPRVSSTAEGGAGAADSAQVFYTGTAVTTKGYVILAYCNYESGLSTAGNWNVSPDTIQLFGRGIPLPGEIIQTQRTATGTVATGSTAVPNDNTIPQNTEGDQYMTQAITPVSAADVLEVDVQAFLAIGGNNASVALFQDSTANALAASNILAVGSNSLTLHHINHWMLAGTVSATTFKVRAGGTSGTTTFNGETSTQRLGGVLNSYMRIKEIMA